MADDKELSQTAIDIILFVVPICFILGVLFLISYAVDVVTSNTPPAQEQRWKLFIHPAVGEPVELAQHITQDTCEFARQEHVKTAARHGQAIPSLTCVPTIPEWRLWLKEKFGKAQPNDERP